MIVDRRFFFDGVRRPLFGGRLRQAQVDGMTAILDRWERGMPDGDLRFLAYMLATAHHETGRTMQAVRETFAASDAAAISRLERAFRVGKLRGVKTPYWRRDADGKSWLGRGLVQLTHRENYARMSAETGIDLVADPAKAMELDVAAAILVVGMVKGCFTGRRLADFFFAGKEDWNGARRIVNGTDRAALIGTYGKAYRGALRRA